MNGRVWIWTGHMWSDRVRLVLEHYGDRITDVSIFGWSVNRNGDLRETFNPTLLDSYRQKWPHLRFWGAFRNMDDPVDGPRTIFDALRDSAAARAHLADEVQSKMFEKYPWLHGVDIDMESGGDSRSADSEAIFEAVADRAHLLGRKAGAALPPLTSTGSVGSENWVRYYQLGQILDHVEIMSYDFAWNGSAPGPISPGFWMEDVYDWVVTQIDPAKVCMGIPLYGRFWRIHDTPPNLGNGWRGLSGTYYYFWQLFTGYAPWYGDNRHPNAGWLAYRDELSRSMWGLLGAYDWFQPYMVDASSSDVQFDYWSGKYYSVRYGKPSGSPQWSVADNSAPAGSFSEYTFTPRRILDVEGNLVGPYRGFTVTLEMLRREPVAATIIDDYATSQNQLDAIYSQPDGTVWTHAAPAGENRQYRTTGGGRLEYRDGMGTRAIYVQGRGQFASAGTFSVYARGYEAVYDNSGEVRLYRLGTLIGSASVARRTPNQNFSVARLFVLGLRVREDSARVYFSNTEEGVIPTEIEVTGQGTWPGGPVGFDASAEVWVDHTYVGDGWWYQPRESVAVSVDGGAPQEMGRYLRNGIEWDLTINAFRPTTDVDERATRADQWTEYSLLDWGYVHWVGAPFSVDTEHTVRIVHTDHDVWLGKIMLFDQDIGVIGYCNDAQSVLHWRDRASRDWGLGGVAMWSLGQEDVRMWDYFAEGELPAETKMLDG